MLSLRALPNGAAHLTVSRSQFRGSFLGRFKELPNRELSLRHGGRHRKTNSPTRSELGAKVADIGHEKKKNSAGKKNTEGGKTGASERIVRVVQKRETTIERLALTRIPDIPRVVLKRAKAALFRDGGSSIVYSGAIDRVMGRPPPGPGDVVIVADGAETAIAWGVFNPHSMFRVRIMQTEGEANRDPELVVDLPALIRKRISSAVALRIALGLPQPDVTDVFRLVNSEGDRLSGVVADSLGPSTIVVSPSSYWAFENKDVIVNALSDATGVEKIVWRPAMDILVKEEGVVREEDAADTTGQGEGEEGQEAVTNGNGQARPVAEAEQDEERVKVVEDGVVFWASTRGQKTGFYADQRDSRRVLRGLVSGLASSGKAPLRVLDLCCYSGAFALNAALGGAAHVTGVDTSLPALQLAARNATLNSLSARLLQGPVEDSISSLSSSSSSSCYFVCADVMAFMKEAAAAGLQWDVVVLDPPKLAPNRKSLQRALIRYQKMNAMAMRLVGPSSSSSDVAAAGGGFLMSCSCSGAVAQARAFAPMLQAAATSAGRRITLLRQAGASSDHTLDPAHPEGEYLSNVLLYVQK